MARKLFVQEKHIYVDRLYVIPPENLRPKKIKERYDFFDFAIDFCLTFLTSGLWLIWVFVREMKR